MSVPSLSILPCGQSQQFLYSGEQDQDTRAFDGKDWFKGKGLLCKNKDTAAEDVIFLEECTNKFIQLL